MGQGAASELFAPPERLDGVRSYVTPRTLVVGEGAAERLGDRAAELGQVAFLVTYPPGRTTRSGGPAAVRSSLEGAGIRVVQHGIPPDPEVPQIDAAAELCRTEGCDVVVGVGGGGPLDGAKAVAILATNGGSVHDYHTGREVAEAPLPVVAVPTTVGTGSEATAVAVIRNRALGVVKSVRDPGTVPRIAVLDPSLLVSLPDRLLSFGAFDGLSHGIEAYLSGNASAATFAYAEIGVRMLAHGMRSNQQGDPGAGLEELLLGSYFAGLALQAGPGLAHVLAQPITAVTGIPHAQAITALLPRTIAFNEAAAEDGSRFRSLVSTAGGEAAMSLADVVDDLRARLGVAVTLQDLGAEPRHLEAVMAAVRGGAGHIWTNPVRLHIDDVREVLCAALEESTTGSSPAGDE
jgi:alcohol dehydrogenase class IV